MLSFAKIKKLIECYSRIDIISGYLTIDGLLRIFEDLDFSKMVHKKIRIIYGIKIDENLYRILKLQNNTKNNSYLYNNIYKLISEKILSIKQWNGEKYYNHSKIYIFSNSNDNFGDKCFILGSSNLTCGGLFNNIEENIYITNKDQQFKEFIDYKIKYFDKIWNDNSIFEYSDNHLMDKEELKIHNNIDKDKLLLYYSICYRCLHENINFKDIDEYCYNNKKYVKCKYQINAAMSANKILKRHGGVFLSDVVGMGKTVVAAILFEILKKENDNIRRLLYVHLML